MEIRTDDLKITLILQKERFLPILFFKQVLKSSDNIPRNDKTITKPFFSADNVTGFSVSLLSRRFLMKLSINLVGNGCYFNFSFKWTTSEWNLEKSKTIENVQILKASFLKNEKLVLFSLCYFQSFQTLRIFHDLIRKCVI